MPLNIDAVHVAGNLTRDPQLRAVGETQVAEFSLAINRRFRNRAGEQAEETTFLDVECWGRTAELVGQYLSKGRNVYVIGRHRLHKWQTAEGQNRTKITILAQSVQFIDGAGDRGAPQPPPEHQAASGGSQAAASSLGDDEPPF